MATESAVAPQILASPAATGKSGWLALSYYSFGHFFIDLYSNALGVFAPMLVNHMGITLTQAGLLGGVMAFSSSVTQPLYGYLSDRFRSPLFATLAPAVTLAGSVHVGRGADLGTRATCIPGVSVGAWSVIGAGAVVTRDIPDGVTAVGVPARALMMVS